MKDFECLAFVEGDVAVKDAPDGVTTITCEGFTAMLAPQCKPRALLPQSRKRILRDAATRQAQLERFMQLGTVLPLCPGFRFEHASPKAFVRVNQKDLHQLSERFHNAAQYQITVDWAADQVLSHFRNTEEIGALFAQDRVTSPELHRGVIRLAARLAKTIKMELEGVSKDLLLQPVAENLLFNGVVLIDEIETLNLDLALERIDAIWTEGFTIRQIGPAPASSFALINPIWVPAEAVIEAHHALGLNPGADAETVARARKTALMAPGCDVGQIRMAADTVIRATALNQPDQGFYRCDIRCDDQSFPTVSRRAVA